MASRDDELVIALDKTNCSKKAPFRRVSSLQPVKNPAAPKTRDVRRANSLVAFPDQGSTIIGKHNVRTNALGQGLKVRFIIDAKEDDTSSTDCQRSTHLSNRLTQDDDQAKNKTRPRRSSFRDIFRASFQRQNASFKDVSNKTGTAEEQDGDLSKSKQPTITAAENLAGIPSMSNYSCAQTVKESDPDLAEERHLWARFGTQPHPFHFQRSQSTKSRGKPITEEDDEDDSDVAHSVTEGSFLYRSSSFMIRHLPASRQSWFYRHRYNVASSEGGSFSPYGHQDPKSGRYCNEKGHVDEQTHPGVAMETQINHSHRMKQHIAEILGGLFGHVQRGRSPRRVTATQRSSPRRLTGHSLASVELGSWAARGSRRSSSLPPFCASLAPSEASSRGEILQTVSSAIIHLFQRKPLKENELGVLQEHVRFLIKSEAGGLVHEYYKDQLLRKGMIILREKIKNEQGLELLNQICETWEYFFKEILPTLQAILYPLMDLLAEDETIRSLSLLAFRNIVVLKVSIKEALDSVDKHTYPTSIQQMLLVLQSIQDNVFLSENQFLLEKLVARVVCPYLGQRGVYEGSPDPVIKVKLKPIPIIIPTGVMSDKFPGRSRHKLEHQTFASPVSPWKGGSHDINSIRKLKPVLEHVYDVGRRHSIIS